MFDFRLYDAVEFGVSNFKPIRDHAGSIVAQLGNKPAFVFVGEAFESNPILKQTRSLLLDYFRGRQIDHINLKGLDRVIFVTHAPLAAPAGASADGGVNGSSSGGVGQPQPKLFFRQYAVKFKKSGTKIPRVDLVEMGPHMDLDVRRRKTPPVDLEKEAMTQPKVAPKKQKNVAGDVLDGKVGRIYMPKQNVETMALNKMKGLKRERRESKAAAAAAPAGGDGEDGGRSKRTRKAAADE
jgi:ribosome production factor 2